MIIAALIISAIAMLITAATLGHQRRLLRAAPHHRHDPPCRRRVHRKGPGW
jgi:hypothetical protein